MKVEIINQNGKLQVVAASGQVYDVLHRYIRQTIVKPRKLNCWSNADNAKFHTETQKVGVALALRSVKTDDVVFGFSRLSEKEQLSLKFVRKNGQISLQEVVVKDHFNKKLGLEIAAGKALSGKDVKFPFYYPRHAVVGNMAMTLEKTQPDVYDGLMDVYNMAQKYFYIR